jgi:hypothetical protein
MTKLSIDLGEEMTAFICAEAARRGVTVEQYLGDVVREATKEAFAYQKNHQELMEMLKHPFGGTFEKGRPPTREEIYDERLSRFR